MFGVLTIIIVGSLIEAVYYFKLAGFMFSKDEKKELLHISLIQKAAFLFATLVLIMIGIAPMIISNFLLDAAHAMIDSQNYINILVG